MDVAQPDERARPCDAAMARVQDADFGFLVGQHGFDELCTHPLPRRTARAEPVFDHPLDERFAHHRACVVKAGGGAHAFADVVGRARRDAIDHRVRA